ncbi:GVQW3 protein, partial [Acromyrmex charruanus]
PSKEPTSKFLVKLGKNGQEILQMLEMVYGESAGHPSTLRVDENIQRVHDLVTADRRITTRMMEVIPITPQMLRIAVKELQKHQLFVKLKNLRDHIQKYYPVETDLEILEQELQEKLKYAVCVGLIAKYGDDQYCIPTLREEANTVKTAISAFWEMYKNVTQYVNVLFFMQQNAANQ